MNESDYIGKLFSLWPTDGETSKEALAMVDSAVQIFPDSAKLWCMRGDLILLGPADIPYDLEEALTCYERSVSIDPQFAEGYEEIGHFFDAVMPNAKRARRAFRQAASIRAARNR